MSDIGQAVARIIGLKVQGQAREQRFPHQQRILFAHLHQVLYHLLCDLPADLHDALGDVSLSKGGRAGDE